MLKILQILLNLFRNFWRKAVGIDWGPGGLCCAWLSRRTSKECLCLIKPITKKRNTSCKKAAVFGFYWKRYSSSQTYCISHLVMFCPFLPYGLHPILSYVRVLVRAANQLMHRLTQAHVFYIGGQLLICKGPKRVKKRVSSRRFVLPSSNLTESQFRQGKIQFHPIPLLLWCTWYIDRDMYVCNVCIFYMYMCAATLTFAQSWCPAINVLFRGSG